MSSMSAPSLTPATNPNLVSGNSPPFSQEEQKIKSLSPAANEPLTIGLFFDVSGSRHTDTHVTDETRLTSELVHSIWH